jgi:Undecaprenyl-phosphate galactose phosphotransferase WbaP
VKYPGLVQRRAQSLKRALDIVLALLALPVALPLCLLIAAAIRLETRSPVLFGHLRVGRGGRRFRVWKFRSMVEDADAVLAHHLKCDPALRAEWRLSHKLKRDPRVTRAGRLLRRSSLDELPQLWNVLRGEMSLVGPRPIVEEEIPKYGPEYALYAQVRPGLTGLWQVSGRNDTSYRERRELDSRYIRDWSLWLDACVCCKTLRVVVLGLGAY